MELSLAVSHPPIQSLSQQASNQCNGTWQTVPSWESRDGSDNIKALAVN